MYIFVINYIIIFLVWKFRELCKDKEKGKKEKVIEKNKKCKNGEGDMGLHKRRQKKENTSRRINKRRKMERTLWEYTKRQGRENYREEENNSNAAGWYRRTVRC